MADPPRQTPQPAIPPPTPPGGTPRRTITQEVHIIGRKSVIWQGVVTFVGVCGTIGAILFGRAWFTGEAVGAARTQIEPVVKDVAIQAERHNDLRQDLVEHKRDEARVLGRIEKSLEALMDKTGVPKSARPTKEDE